MRRKFLRITMALLVGGVLLIALMRIPLSLSGAEPLGWRLAMQRYLEWAQGSAGSGLEVAAAEPASRPWEFRRGMSARSFGRSTYYVVDVPYGAINGPRPLPFPPAEVWCVHLWGRASGSSAGVSDQLVFVAKHVDLYNADWIVHEPYSEASQRRDEMLSKIGCR